MAYGTATVWHLWRTKAPKQVSAVHGGTRAEGKSAQPAQSVMWDCDGKHPRCTKAPERASAVHKGTQAGASQHSRHNRQCGTATASIRGAQRHPSGHLRRTRHTSRHPQCTRHSGGGESAQPAQSACGTATASIRGAHRHPSGHPQCTRHPSGGESPQPAQSVWDRNSSGICSADGSQRGWHIRMAGQGGNCWMACGDHDCGAICIWQGCQV